MTPKEYLQRYKTAQKEAEDVELRITQLRLRYAAPSAIEYSDMPRAHDSEHDLSDYMAKMDELTSYLVEKYKRCMGIEVDIYQRLDSMDRQEEREVLRYRYIDGMTWEQIAQRTGYVLRHIYRLHGNALQNFPLPE